MKTLAVVAAAVVLSATAHAQTATKTFRIGVLHNGNPGNTGHITDAFRGGLADLGYSEGKNVVLDVRYAEGKLDRLPALARELGNANIDVLFAPSALASGAAKKAGVATPIVFALAPDPVADGFVASLARPGGNMTGLTSQSPELGAKRVQIVREALPKAARIGVLYASSFPGVSAELAEVERAVKAFVMELVTVEARRPEDFAAAFDELTKRRADAVLVIENPMFFGNRATIVELAAKHRMPAMYRAKEYVASGGLMSYGADYADLARRAAGYVDRILKGARPGDLPIEQPVKFEFVVNAGAARALGVALPRELLLRADKVVD